MLLVFAYVSHVYPRQTVIELHKITCGESKPKTTKQNKSNLLPLFDLLVTEVFCLFVVFVLY